MPMIRRRRVSATSSSAAVWHLDQRGQPEALGRGLQVAQQRRLEDRHDQQHRVGPRRARLPELLLVEREVLAEQRHRDAAARIAASRSRLPWKYFSSVSTEMAAAPWRA